MALNFMTKLKSNLESWNIGNLIVKAQVNFPPMYGSNVSS